MYQKYIYFLFNNENEPPRNTKEITGTPRYHATKLTLKIKIYTGK
jgi:hypothetical protein